MYSDSERLVKMKFKHYRNATSKLIYGGYKILVDPCLSPKNTFRNVPMKYSQILNLLKKEHPVHDLSDVIDDILDVDIVLSTHRHFDHFDKVAVKSIAKDQLIVCQKEDMKRFKREGFTYLKPIETQLEIGEMTIHRVHADHSKIGGVASGYILSVPNEPVVYLAGDTVYGPHIDDVFHKFKPDVVVINGGGAIGFNQKLIMGIQDIEKTVLLKPQSDFIIVHLDEISHCTVSRKSIQEYFSIDYLLSLNVRSFKYPMNGEMIVYE